MRKLISLCNLLTNAKKILGWYVLHFPRTTACHGCVVPQSPWTRCSICFEYGISNFKGIFMNFSNNN